MTLNEVVICLTCGLPELVEHHHIKWVVEMLSQHSHIMSCQPINAVDGFIL